MDSKITSLTLCVLLTTHRVFLGMRFFKWQVIFLSSFAFMAKAQLTYTFENNVSVIENDMALTQPFSGGFIAPQFSTIDLNRDGIDDLFVFDRASSKIFTYLFDNGRYVYAPFYESLFPKGLKNWALLRDYNCDGKMDLFASSIFGMSLYENTSVTELNWKLINQTIYTEGSNGQTNLQVSGGDLPAIVDVDNDGDLDILNFNFATGGGIEFHKNYSIENTGICGVELKRETRKYGDFMECTCDTYAFGPNKCPTGGRVAHSGGKSILSFSYSSEIMQDLLIGQEYCDLPGYLINNGTMADAKMEAVSFDFPNANNPLRLEYPAFYELDLFNDGVLDLLSSPNIFEPDGLQNYKELQYRYIKSTSGNYEFVNNRFLKEEMIDVGHNASPVFADIDFDGDDDLFIGTGIIGEGASLVFYENIGSPNHPSFVLRADDYLGLKQQSYEKIKTQMFDVNKNGFLDLVLTITTNNNVKNIAYLHSGNPLAPYSNFDIMNLVLPDITSWDSPYLYAIGSKTALFVGKQAGNLMYYTSSAGLESANWQLVSSAYLGIEEDFSKRNLTVTIADFNGNESIDMVTINDSGEVLVYDNFLNEKNALNIKGLNTNANTTFNLNFGKLTTVTTANLFAKLEPNLVFGLLTGGIQVLSNTVSTDVSKPLVFKMIGYPNPITSNQLLVQANKPGVARLLDATGKEVITGIGIKEGSQNRLYLGVVAGVYFLEMVTETNEKQVLRIVVDD